MAEYNRRASAKIGMLPGTAIYVGKEPPQSTRILTHIYDSQSYQVLEGFQSNDIQKALKSGNNVWVDIIGLADSTQINDLCLEFSIHPLIIEDLLNTHQRPKLDIFEEYLFIVFKLLDNPPHKPSYNSEQFSMVLKSNLLLTVRETEDYSLHNLYKSLALKQSIIREHGTDYLAYLIMDNIIDDYFNFVEETALSLEKMEDLLIKDPEAIKLDMLYTIKRRTLTLRKTIAPIKDIVHLLLTEQNNWIRKKHHLYYRDLHDHCTRLLEMVDLHRDMTTSMLDIYLSTLNNRMNETMKLLTLFASIFIPLTFIAGIYGMNFEYMPELKLRYAYPVVLIGMAALAFIMLYYFKRKKLL
ncbi:magnesium/cobalt transporter CorA [Legionella israelensis]|uniref:magnesium/cobalt transporter CorA n=1 Tax=Legionella israelensis TaxID=454 RepID=UPI001FD3786C|nr:magnesium/cobalt transporter CorA [Legionella israelensis]